MTCVSLLAAAVGLATVPVHASYIAPDNGSGTVTLPAAGPYRSPDEVFTIIDGLPAGTTIELAPEWKNFAADPGGTGPLPPGIIEGVGGSLGGTLQYFYSDMEWTVTGTGDLAGFNRLLTVPLLVETHAGPRNPGDAVQSFSTEMYSMEGELLGDPDFCTLRLRAGTDLGLPSPGHTTLTRLGPPGSDFQVDSFFDITYQIEFQGCPASVLDGFEGTTTGTIRMEQTPEPATLALVGLGVAGLAMRRRRRRTR